MNYNNTLLSKMVGDDTESAYAKAFVGKIVGGLGDNGLDVQIGEKDIPAVQVKSSIVGLKSFLAESLRRHQFIPVCVGEPGNKAEMLDSLRKFGAWIGKDVPRRLECLQSVATVRSMCAA